MRSGVAARRGIRRHQRGQCALYESVRPAGNESAEKKVRRDKRKSSKMFCSRNVIDRDGGQEQGFRTSVGTVSTDFTDASAHNMCPCAVKLTQLIDMTRCASYDVSAMTNGAAKVLVLDVCVT